MIGGDIQEKIVHGVMSLAHPSQVDVATDIEVVVGAVSELIHDFQNTRA